MKKSVLALIAAIALACTAGLADAQRGGGGGGGGRGGGGWSGGGGHGGGSWQGGGSGWHGGSSGWHGGSRGWYGGGWHGGYRGGWYGGGWYGCYGCGWGWAGAAVIATSPWWGWPYWWNAPYWGATYPVATTYTTYDPMVYVEQSQPPANAPAVPSGAPVTWFYCTSPPGYYPYVQSCSKPWMRVVPDATQPPPSMQPQPAPQG